MARQERSLTAAGKAEDAATSEGSLVVSHHTEHALPTRPRDHAPRCFPRGGENTRPHKNLHTHAYGSVTRNCHTRKPPRCSSAGGRTPELSIRSTGEYPALRGNEPSRHEETQRDRKRESLRDGSRSGKAASCVTPATGLCGEGTAVETVTGPWLQAWWGGGMKRRSTGDLEGRLLCTMP